MKCYRVILLFIGMSFFAPLLAVEPTPDPTEIQSTIELHKSMMKDIEKNVEKDFSYNLPETPQDFVEVKRAASLLLDAASELDTSKQLKVYWKKTRLRVFYSETRQEGYYVLVEDPRSHKANFGSFFSGIKDLTLEQFGDLGVLKLRGKTVEDCDCEGGSYTQPYIVMAAEKLLESKPISLLRKDLKPRKAPTPKP